MERCRCGKEIPSVKPNEMPFQYCSIECKIADNKNVTFKDALENGWRLAWTSWERGYISRKTKINDQLIIKGRFNYYVNLPSWKSTKYCVRQYILPPN